jgi:hypothetical protein
MHPPKKASASTREVVTNVLAMMAIRRADGHREQESRGLLRKEHFSSEREVPRRFTDVGR